MRSLFFYLMGYVVIFAICYCDKGIAQSRVWEGQPQIGPGGSHYPHREVRHITTSSFEVFEPAAPTLTSAPMLIYISSKAQNWMGGQRAMFRHAARKGILVVQLIYDESQGPKAAFRSLRRALRYVRRLGRVKPDSRGVAFGGFSSGGYMAVYLANRAEVLGLGPVRSFVGHDYTPLSTYACQAQPINRSFPLPAGATFSKDAVVVYTVSEQMAEVNIQNAGQNKAFVDWQYWEEYPNKNLLFVHSDDNAPRASIKLNDFSKRMHSDHYAVLGIRGVSFILPNLFIGGSSPLRIDPLDWNVYWKTTVASVQCGFNGSNCDYILGDHNSVKHVGRWANGEPIRSLSVASELELGEANRCQLK